MTLIAALLSFEVELLLPLILISYNYVSITLTSNVWLFDAPIESVRSISIVYFPTLSELTGLMVYLRELELKLMNDGRTDYDFSNVEYVIDNPSSS